MRTRFTSSRVLTILALFLSTSLLPSMAAADSPPGLSSQALQELADAGVNKYLGDFEPVSSQDVGDGWVKHTFDPDGGNGPICIAGTQYSAFTRAGNPAKLLIMLQGGGACWQDLYRCNIFAEAQEPPVARIGIWDFDSKDNPFADYSIVYMPYCDGSVFGGDNDVVDGNFPLGPLRRHRGLRNVSAGMDLAKATFPHAEFITVAGSSAGGVGAAAFTPFLARFLYGNTVQHLTVRGRPTGSSTSSILQLVPRAVPSGSRPRSSSGGWTTTRPSARRSTRRTATRPISALPVPTCRASSIRFLPSFPSPTDCRKASTAI
jgi:hypothetical protein